MVSSITKKYKPISVARAVLAALWYPKQQTLKTISRHPYCNLLCSDRKRGTYRSTISRLFKKGFIVKNEDRILLTKTGQENAIFAFVDAETSLFKTNFFEKWDGAWRIIFFDIPEQKRKHRDYLRRILKRVGFKEVQRSIWAYPYPVPTFLKVLILDPSFKSWIKFITTDSFEGDEDLRKTFNLSLIL